MALGPISTPRRSAPRSIGTLISVISIAVFLSCVRSARAPLRGPVALAGDTTSIAHSGANGLPDSALLLQPSVGCQKHDGIGWFHHKPEGGWRASWRLKPRLEGVPPRSRPAPTLVRQD